MARPTQLTIATAFFGGLLLAASGGMAGCGQGNSNGDILRGADTTCIAGTGQIAVGDGYQEVLCGCQEPGGQILGRGGTPLTCTVPAGTQIFIYYQGTRLRHQVIPTTGLSFPASVTNDPAAKPPYLVHTFQLTQPGTYNYTDSYDAAIVGQFVVQ